MFTGIIQNKIEILNLEDSRLYLPNIFDNLNIGESISVDGVCLTVSYIRKKYISFDVSNETKRKSIFNFYKIGTIVNLERPLKFGDYLGGHFVLGHVDKKVKLISIKNYNNGNKKLVFSGLEKTDLIFLSEKGSISINGVSLTINSVIKNGFIVLCVPYTLDMTNLSNLKVENFVNLEFDCISKLLKNLVN